MQIASHCFSGIKDRPNVSMRSCTISPHRGASFINDSLVAVIAVSKYSPRYVSDRSKPITSSLRLARLTNKQLTGVNTIQLGGYASDAGKEGRLR